jgi:hypothetical protein
LFAVVINSNPPIPKRLAKQISHAQARVLDARNRIISAELRIKEESAELDIYAQNPRDWVTKVYGPKMAIDAYPPTTRISRIQEDYKRRIARRPIRALSYHQALEDLDKLEQRILNQLAGMRPSSGRVAWPSPLAPFEGYDSASNICPDTKTQVQLLEAKELGVAQDLKDASSDDGAPFGDGSRDALLQRRQTFAEVSLKSGILILRNGVSLTVKAWSEDCIEAMQAVINKDQSGGVSGNVWDIAVGLILTGCDWPGYEEWWATINTTVRSQLDLSNFRIQRSFDADRHAEAKELSNLISSCLSSCYLPEELVSLPSFFYGEVAKPSQLFQFWKEAGFSEIIARNWFLKSQPSVGLFRVSDQPYGRETWSAIQNIGLVQSGSDIPLSWSLAHFPRSTLADVIKDLDLTPSRRTSGCREILLSISDPNKAIRALGIYGYEDLRATLPPTQLTWTQFQGWRMQIRCMAALISDLFFNKVPQSARAVLLGS